MDDDTNGYAEHTSMLARFPKRHADTDNAYRGIVEQETRSLREKTERLRRAREGREKAFGRGSG